MKSNDTNIKIKKIHHANIVVGGDCRQHIFTILKTHLNFKVQANPDFLLFENQFFGIDDARNFEKWIIGKPLIKDIKVSFIITKSITHEAQNALLKVLEEPPFGTYIFINIENLGGLLPTFMSRVRILNVEIEKELDDNYAAEFLQSNINERFSIINFLTKKKDKNAMKNLIKNLERYAYRNDKLNPKSFEYISKAKILVSSKGSSPKIILEWLSCML
ncbi:MAG: hypothetical protein JW740_03365 [Candidatus Zambryskibacteria bacterium]|nr:hypothetical protein [Candidatus Zambryskibacteria bacterium]